MKSRIVVRGYAEVIDAKDDTFASAPSSTTLKLLLALAISRGWFIFGADVSTVFSRSLFYKLDTYMAPSRILP